MPRSRAHSRGSSTVVGEASRCQDEHAFVAERREKPAEREMKAVEPALDRELDDRDVGGREDEAKRDPGTMVEAAAGVAVHFEPARLNQAADPLGEFGRSWRRIAHFIQGAREPVKVVDRLIDGDDVHRRLIVSQWAETTRIARGVSPSSSASRSRKARAGVSVSGRVGAPWETKSEGSMVEGSLPISFGLMWAAQIIVEVGKPALANCSNRNGPGRACTL